MSKQKESYSLEDYLEYRELLAKTAANPTKDIIYNDSFVHAEMVMNYILQYSMDKSIKEINMYCGKFSLFRDSAKKAIGEQKDRVKPDEDDEKRMELWNDFNPYEKLMTRVMDFFKAGNSLNVIIENDIADIITEESWNVLGQHVESGLLKIKKLELPLGLNHFVVSGNCYRRENDDDEKTAICCFDDETTCTSLRRDFQALMMMSRPYSLS